MLPLLDCTSLRSLLLRVLEDLAQLRHGSGRAWRARGVKRVPVASFVCSVDHRCPFVGCPGRACFVWVPFLLPWPTWLFPPQNSFVLRSCQLFFLRACMFLAAASYLFCKKLSASRSETSGMSPSADALTKGEPLSIVSDDMSSEMTSAG